MPAENLEERLKNPDAGIRWVAAIHRERDRAEKAEAALADMQERLLSGEDRARLELIRDHDGNDLSENDKALLTRLAGHE